MSVHVDCKWNCGATDCNAPYRPDRRPAMTNDTPRTDALAAEKAGRGKLLALCRTLEREGNSVRGISLEFVLAFKHGSYSEWSEALERLREALK